MINPFYNIDYAMAVHAFVVGKEVFHHGNGDILPLW